MSEQDHPLIGSIVAWAGRRDDVRAVVLRASREAAEGTGDSLADFDVDLHVRDVDAFAGEEWLEEIAPVIIAADEDEEDGVPVRLVFFTGQQRVDFRLRTGDVPEDEGLRVLFRSPAPGGPGGPPAVRPAPGGLGAAADLGPEEVADAEVVPGVGVVPNAPSPTDVTTGAALPALRPRSGDGPALRSLVPVFSAPDVPAWLTHYRALGFDVHEDADGDGYAFRDGLELRVVADRPDAPGARGHAYAAVDDPDALHREWASVPGSRTTVPSDRPDGSREGSHADPAGNVVRFGRPG